MRHRCASVSDTDGGGFSTDASSTRDICPAFTSARSPSASSSRVAHSLQLSSTIDELITSSASTSASAFDRKMLFLLLFCCL